MFKLLKTRFLAGCFAALSLFSSSGGDVFNSGFLYDQFELTLESGTRTEVMGPLYYNQDGEEARTWGFPPFFIYSTNKIADSEEMDVLYPLWTYDRFGEQKRWQFFQIINRSLQSQMQKMKQTVSTEKENELERFRLLVSIF